jgi:hypothetical protein
MTNDTFRITYAQAGVGSGNRIHLTDLEHKLLRASRHTDMGDAGDGGTYTWAVFETAKVTAQVGRGVVSSLVRKGLALAGKVDGEELFDLTEQGKIESEKPYFGAYKGIN